MKTALKISIYTLALAVSFGLGNLYGLRKMPASREAALAAPSVRVAVTPEPQTTAPVSLVPSSDVAAVYALAALSPQAALEQAMKLPGAARLPAMQNLMAMWLRVDRLAVAEWMTERRGLREFEPLSAQVSDAFFPDDTEMSAMFSFDLTDEKLRDVRVNRLVAYWKSGAHLKFDNSPWEVDGPGSAQISAKEPADAQAEKPAQPTTATDTQG